MLVISSREFRANQSKYLGKAASGEDVILKSRTHGSFQLKPITEDDTLMSKSEMLNKIERARKSIEEGKGIHVSTRENLMDFLDKL